MGVDEYERVSVQSLTSTRYALHSESFPFPRFAMNLSLLNRTSLVVGCLLLPACLLPPPRAVLAQSVCLPSPRLLTVTPMGGQIGSEFEVTITGQHLEGTEQLIFSNPAITATPKVKDDGSVVENQFVIQIDKACPTGVYDARVMAGLGISSARAFSVGRLPEITQQQPSISPEQALEVPVGTLVNATLKDRSINHYAFDAKRGQRIVIDCAANGIDSKTNPVIALADETGSDLVVERRGGIIDFEVPADGRYIAKVHDLTFKGGPYYFYRLAITELAPDEHPTRLPSTNHVASFSWPPTGLADEASGGEVEPNDAIETSQQIRLPCDIAGSFYPAADVDSFQFQGKKGERWWVEVASERFGLLTDPSVVVQRLTEDGQPVDVAELADIPSPVKRSSNGYSYDGPPYNAGSSDAMGEFTIPEDGTYRIRLTDLFGGTRDDPSMRYRMIVRKAQPDFALVGWALHMGLRNGDRNALSKPIALRGGDVMPFEIVVVRRDGFDGEIELALENLPEGVTATGLKIAKGQTRGIVLGAAEPNASRGLKMARLYGKAQIDGREVIHDCRLASMKWPVTNAKQEIPDPRLLDQIPVSVGGVEPAPLSIEVAENKLWEVQEGGNLTIPLKPVCRGPFSGNSMSLRTFGAGFDHNPAFDFSLANDQTDVTLDLAKLKTPPGEYTIAFYGGAVAKYGPGDAKPKDIVDIYVSRPIQIRVTPKPGQGK